MLLTPGTQRTSVFSGGSSKAPSLLEEVNHLSDEELIKHVNNLKQKVKMLNLENEILEKAITRLDPSLMQGVYIAYDYLIRMQSDTDTTFSDTNFSKSNVSKFGFLESIFRPSKVSTSSKMLMAPSRLQASISRTYSRRDASGNVIGSSVIYGLGPRINLNEMVEIASIETDNVTINLNNNKDKAKRREALLHAKLEEIDIREIDIEKAINNFNEEVLINGWDEISQRIPAEIWEGFMADNLKAIDRQIGKLRLRSSTLITHYIKLKGVIQVKKDFKESLTPVDFDKIKIENTQCLKLIEKKKQQLEELKAMTGDANLMLTLHKQALLDQNNYLVALQAKKKERDRLTDKLVKEYDLIQIQVDILEKKLLKVKKIRMAYHVPNIMDYVNVMATITDLKRNIKVLETRVAIKQKDVKSFKRGYNR